MAVVKANYTQGAGAGAALRGSVRYAATRPGEREGERDAFSRDADALDRAEATAVFEDAEGRYVYRLVLNSGEGREVEADLKAWTRDTMGALAERHGAVAWVAYEHRDHSEHAHVHVLAATERKLDKADLERLREAASESWERQERWAQEAYRDPHDRTAPGREQPREPERDDDRGREW